MIFYNNYYSHKKRKEFIMLKDMKIKSSLSAGFSVVVILAAILVSSILIMMSAQKSKYDSLLAKEVTANLNILYARLNANIAARNVRDILLIYDNPDNPQLEQKTMEALAKMDNNLQALQEAWPEGESKANLDAYLASVQKWKAIATEILELYNSGHISKAVTMIHNECSPALNEVAEYGQKVDDQLVANMGNAVSSIDSTVRTAIIVIIVIMVLATLFVISMVMVLIKSITDPTEEVRHALVGFSQGNLSIPVTYTSKNELGEMCDALRTSQTILGSVIEDVNYILTEMAHGNFNVRTHAEDKYVGDLSAMLQSVRVINRQLSDTIRQITSSAEQVASGAEQVASGAQMLAQGATEQASSVEELSSTINNISVQINNTAQNSTNAMNEMNNTGDRVAACNDQMTQMTLAMEEIASKSNEISKIIKTIEDIAFQTNILALNAAVEAARAGDAGKGFAVVADEVRSLAGKSAEASQNTATLIGDTVDAVNRGIQVVTETAETLNFVVEGTHSVSKLVANITEDAQREASALTQVTQGIDQISSVVQTTSATSEESAAASEELSSQANLIKNLMGSFKLRTDRTF